MKRLLLYTFLLLALSFSKVLAQEVYELDPKYPVHDLNTALKVFNDSADQLTPALLLNNNLLPFTKGDELPRLLESNVTYWGKLHIKVLDSLDDWQLHFEDKMIGIPAWTKSNGKVDVYFYVDNKLIAHQKTGSEYPKEERANQKHWVLNSINLQGLPIDKVVTMIIKAQGNEMGYPPYFNLSARSPEQRYYHQIYQFNNSFNIFMFGVTFIVFLYFLLQFIYLREAVYGWFSLWLFFCVTTHAMTIGLILNTLETIRFPFMMLITNGIFYSFWFFGRSFTDSKKKFPKLDRFILGFAFLVLFEIILTILYVVVLKPKVHLLEPGFHFQFLGVYTIASLVLSIILTLKKDLFARYFGIGSLIASLFLIIGTLWSTGIMKPPFRLDPYATGIFLQIVIYSFGMSYRSKKLNNQNHMERLEAQKSLTEIQRIKDLDEIKTRFFTNISHEFRTPLTLIDGPLQQAKKSSVKSYDDSVILSNEAFKVISKNTNRLTMLVDQLLDISRVESGNLYLKLTQGGIIQFLRSHVFSFESLAERENISLNTNFPEELDKGYYDKDKLEKIVNNLLSNAFKYTPRGGAVTVNVSHTKKNLLIEISDTGNGMERKEIDRIFDRFYRVEGSETKGSGIGLALTKELVDFHNGQISVNSEKGRGTTFKVRLPIRLEDLPKSVHPEKESTPIAEEEVASNVQEKTKKEPTAPHDNEQVVLIVEDNQDIQDFIASILGDSYKLLKANNGLQGERMAFEHIPDLVISDVMMPQKDGYQLCSSLKNNVKTSHVPIVMLTAKTGQSSKMAGLTQGADAYLTKPFDADELLLRIKNLIANRNKIWEHFKSSDLVAIPDLSLSSVDDVFLQKVVKFIEENLDNELLSVDDIASKVGFSRAQLHRKLKALTNKSTRQLVNDIRLNKAKNMLKQNVGSVSEIAYSVGYSNMSYFTKSFKEKFGLLPSKIESSIKFDESK